MGGRLVWKGQVDQSVFLFLCLCHCVLVHLQTAPWWWEHNIFLIAILHKTCFTLQAKEWKGQLSLRGKIYHSKQSSVMERISVALFCEVSSRYFWLFFYINDILPSNLSSIPSNPDKNIPWIFLSSKPPRCKSWQNESGIQSEREKI